MPTNTLGTKFHRLRLKIKDNLLLGKPFTFIKHYFLKMTRRNLFVGKIKKSSHSTDGINSHLHSTVVEEVLNLTFPISQKLLPFKKEEFYQLIFNYFFNDDEAMFYEIEHSSNLITACNLKGYKTIIQKNRLTSFSAFDNYMMVKKSKSFDKLNQTLTTREVLSDLEKDKIIGGKKQNGRVNFYFHYPSKTA